MLVLYLNNAIRSVVAATSFIKLHNVTDLNVPLHTLCSEREIHTMYIQQGYKNHCFHTVLVLTFTVPLWLIPT